jgi:biopolymer transport protein TolR
MSYALLRLSRKDAPPEPVTEVVIIPVIDISLVLLVILFVTAPLLSYPNLPVALPKADAPRSKDEGLAVTYTRDGRLAVRSAELSWPELEGALRRELSRDPGSQVVLRVDKSVPYRIVARLMAGAKAAGAKSIALAAESPR